jgi:hypothetical protein
MGMLEVKVRMASRAAPDRTEELLLAVDTVRPFPGDRVRHWKA